MSSLILTVIGPDRPGLVSELSQVIRAHEANWLESRMARLAGQFTGIIEVAVPDGAADGLTQELTDLRKSGLRVHVTRVAGDGNAAGEGPQRSLRLELIGHDRPGIVRDLARALAGRGINVTQLETRTVSAPMSGEQLFKAEALLTAPVEADKAELDRALDQLAAELDLDLELAEAAAAV